MKSKVILTCLLLSSALLFGCAENVTIESPNNSNGENLPATPSVPEKPTTPPKPSKPSKPDIPKPEDDRDVVVDNSEKADVASYFPIKENTRYIYEGAGSEFSSYNVYTSYTKENRVQTRTDNGGTVVADVIEVKDGEVRKLFSRPETYYRENLIRESLLNSQDKTRQEVLLKSPIKKGTSWKLNDGRVRTITSTSVDVTTPVENYKAIEVTTIGEDNTKTMDYYAKNVGLVKSMFIADGMEVSSTLKEIQNNTLLTQDIKFYYPNIDDDKLYYKNRNVDFKTNDITRKTLEREYKEVLKDTNSSVLTPNTKINYLYLNKDGMVYIDLSKDFLKELNAGAGYESMILQSIAATFGNYYNTKKVVLTIDGGKYESGHILLEKGDYLEADYENAVDGN